MLESCPLSCGVCSAPTTQVPTPAPTRAPWPTPGPPPPPGPCSDENPSCVDWAAGGACETNPGFMLESCPLSCGVCSAPTTRAPTPAPTRAPWPTPGPLPPPGPCSDENPSCADWAAGGACQTNPGFMLESCPLSCGVCSPTTQAPTWAPTRAPAPAPLPIRVVP